MDFLKNTFAVLFPQSILLPGDVFEHITKNTSRNDHFALRMVNRKARKDLSGTDPFPPSVVFSSVQRAMWVRNWQPETSQPPWLSEWSARTCSIMARVGNLEVLQWARANGCPWDKWTCFNAARGGHLEVLQWARNYGCPWDVNKCFDAALQQGHREVREWINDNS